MSRLRIEKPNKEKSAPKNKHAVKVAVLLVFAVLVGAVVYFYAMPAKMYTEAFEVSDFSGDVQIFDKATGQWVKAERGSLVKTGDRIRTAGGAEANLQMSEKVRVRVKQNSEFGFLGNKAYEKNPYLRAYLHQGEVLAATQKGFTNERFDIETPYLVAQSQGGYFRVQTSAEAKNSWLGLMKGKARIKTNEFFGGQTYDIHGLEVAEAGQGKPLQTPRHVSKDEWQALSEVYQLTQKSAAVEAEQLDLSKKAGNLFDFVFDHGTFYTPEFGYANRDFFKDENSGSVYLEIEYDVFPKGSFVGMYLKSRELDLAKFSALEFEMRQVQDEGFPQAIRIEVKSKNGVVRAFAAKLPRKDWEKVIFPLNVKDSTLATELALVFLHERVGEYKKGSVQFRNFNLVKADPSVVKTAVVVKPVVKVEPPVVPAVVPVVTTVPAENTVTAAGPSSSQPSKPKEIAGVKVKPVTL